MNFSVGSNPISPTDYSYILLQQKFRSSHDYSLFLKPYPYTLSEFSDAKVSQIFSPNTNPVIVSINPSIQVWQDTPVFSLNYSISSSWKNLSSLIEPIILNEPYGPDLLGTNYVRSSLSGRIFNSFVRYNNDLLSIQLGRSPVWWGQSWNHSIIQSGHAPAYDHLDLRMNFGFTQLEILAGQLGSESLNGLQIRRNIAGHRLTWISETKIFLISFGELIIYTGINRGTELVYLNPAVPYFFNFLDGDLGVTDSTDNDNSILFVTTRYTLRSNISLYGEILIDDFQIDDKNIQNSLGYKIGLEGFFAIFGLHTTGEIEWTRINTWTYINHGQFTSWQNRGHAIGFPYGPDLSSLHIQADMWVSDVLLFNVEADWLKKGSNTLSTEWANLDTKNDPFPKPHVTNHVLLATSLSWYWQHGIVEAGWSNYPFPNRIAYSDPQSKTKGGFFLKAQLFYDFGFDLD